MPAPGAPLPAGTASALHRCDEQEVRLVRPPSAVRSGGGEPERRRTETRDALLKDDEETARKILEELAASGAMIGEVMRHRQAAAPCP